MNVLVVEDDEMILEGIKYSLTQEGYQVLSAMSVAEAMDWIHGSTQVEFCLFDVMLPDGNGFEICLEMRKTSKVPIIFLTACDDEVSTVRALELGADDYLVKPFGMMEMVARIKALLRRVNKNEGKEIILSNGSIIVNQRKHTVLVDGNSIILTLKEYDLLTLFLSNIDYVFTREHLLEKIWGLDFLGESRTVDVHIGTLRTKLGKQGNLIQTVRGVGYKMVKDYEEKNI